MIKIKCDYLNGAVAVPTDVIDKFLKLAPAASFKVLLFILRNPDGAADAQQIAMCTGLAAEDVADCLVFWESHDIIAIDDKFNAEAAKNAVGNAKIADIPEEKPQNLQKTNASVRSLPVKKPTQRDIALRLAEEPELTLICNEAQTILGTFGYDTQALIVMIYDYYGFPPEVIITLLQHQKCENKTSSSAIKSRAEDWAKRGIDTLEAVEEELLLLEKVKNIYGTLKGLPSFTGDSPSPRISKYLYQWAGEWGCSKELIKYALDEADNVLSDANKLLKKWVNSGFTEPLQVQEQKKKALPKEIKKSYDTEKVGRSSVLDWAKKYASKEENE
ncbi:MAG: DnaD domain protein [Clostridia bacterium]|nr:DnaD domain protein [Clostridia bacterium]